MDDPPLEGLCLNGACLTLPGDRERGNLQASLFPPANVADLHLEHCRRILPHDQNTGGFFVAVLEKVGDLPWMGTKPKVMKRPQQLRQPQQGMWRALSCHFRLLLVFTAPRSP